MPGNSFIPELNHLEVQYIEASRKSLRLAQPAKVFLHQHIQESKFHLFFQSLTALISISLFFTLAFIFLFGVLDRVQGLGLVDDSTAYDKLTYFIILFIFIKRTRLLVKSSEFSKRTKLALFCNAVNLFMWVYILYALVLFLALRLVVISFGIANDIAAYEALTSNYKVGIVSDVSIVIENTFFIFFALFVCRHFARGIES